MKRSKRHPENSESGEDVERETFKKNVGRADIIPRSVAGAVCCVTFLIGVAYLVFGVDALDYLPVRPVCVFKLITGKPCPSCGMTHAFIHISQFKFQEAFLENPFSYILLLLLGFYSIIGDIPKLFKSKTLFYALFAVFLCWGLARMVGV